MTFLNNVECEILCKDQKKIGNVVKYQLEKKDKKNKNSNVLPPKSIGLLTFGNTGIAQLG